MLKISTDENDLLQEKFRDYIIVKPGTRPMPLLMKAIFTVAQAHLDLTKSSFAEMCDYEKSKSRFSLYYALFIDVTDLSEAELANRKAEHGIKGRYLDKAFELGDRKYLVCKEFYLNKGGYKIKLYEWFCELFGMTCIDFVNEVDVNNAITDYEIEIEEQGTIILNNCSEQYSIEYLDTIRTSAAGILLRVEKDAIEEAVTKLKENQKLERDLLLRVENIIKKLKVYKEILLNIEL